ncbi:MAG: hypothetical protein WA049_07980 [Ferribacterium limneticum]
MVILTDPSDLPMIANPAIRHLITLRFQQLAPVASPPTPCQFIVVEGGDAVSEIEQAVGYPILTSLFDELPYTDPGFQPCSELLEEHRNEHCCIYEMVFEGSGDGAIACFIPDEEGIDSALLSVCRSWATPAVSLP